MIFRNRITKGFLALCTTLTLTIPTFIQDVEAKPKKTNYSYRNAVKHTFLRENGVNAHLIKVDLNNPRVSLELALAYNNTNRKENVSKMAQRTGAIAAINGSFFHSRDSIHSAVGLLMAEGVVITDSGHRRTSLGITDENKVIIGIPKVKNFITMPEIGVNLPVNTINQVRGKNHITIYNNYFGKTTRTKKKGREILVDSDNRIVGYKFNNSPIPKNGFVISMANADSRIADKYPVGTQVYINSVINSPWNRAKTIITGSPQLIKNGKIYNTYYKEKLQPSIKGPATRTAVGITYDNKLLLVTATGNATFSKLAGVMKKLGSKDALALDGGGSTDMYLAGKNVITNYRPVTNALVVKLSRG